MQSLLEAACVAASIALEHGMKLENLAHSMGRTRISKTETRPASIADAIAEGPVQGPVVEKAEVARW